MFLSFRQEIILNQKLASLMSGRSYRRANCDDKSLAASLRSRRLSSQKMSWRTLLKSLFVLCIIVQFIYVEVSQTWIFRHAIFRARR